MHHPVRCMIYGLVIGMVMCARVNIVMLVRHRRVVVVSALRGRSGRGPVRAVVVLMFMHRVLIHGNAHPLYDTSRILEALQLLKSFNSASTTLTK